MCCVYSWRRWRQVVTVLGLVATRRCGLVPYMPLAVAATSKKAPCSSSSSGVHTAKAYLNKGSYIGRARANQNATPRRAVDAYTAHINHSALTQNDATPPRDSAPRCNERARAPGRTATIKSAARARRGRRPQDRNHRRRGRGPGLGPEPAALVVWTNIRPEREPVGRCAGC